MRRVRFFREDGLAVTRQMVQPELYKQSAAVEMERSCRPCTGIRGWGFVVHTPENLIFVFLPLAVSPIRPNLTVHQKLHYMKNEKDPRFNRLDAIEAENNLLKVKLQLEHGMRMDHTTELDPELENQWLKSVYAFEQQFTHAKKTKVYDYIGQPPFRKWNTLSAEELRKELQVIQIVMENKGVELDCICEYDDAVIYKFITEELFQQEMDDMRVSGMTCHFIYEEFHPNHDYDLRKQSNEFLEAIFSRPWDSEFNHHLLAPKVLCSGEDHDRSHISAFIKTFQEAHAAFCVRESYVTDVAIDLELARANVKMTVSVTGKMKQGDRIRYEGDCSLEFLRMNDYWSITRFHVPGLTRPNG